MTSAAPTLLDIHRAVRDLDGAAPADVMRWAADRFGDGLVVTASFGDAALVHVAASAVPGVEIVLIDTGYLFAETLWYAERLRSSLDLNLTIVRPEAAPGDTDQWEYDTDGCCGVNKVEPLNRALGGRSGWATGLRRADGESRASAQVVSYDVGRSLVKVNPIVAWTDDDVDDYHRLHDLPRNPLSDRGYPSIGCWPCTRPVEAGRDPRSGRWSGSDKTECGLHL